MFAFALIVIGIIILYTFNYSVPLGTALSGLLWLVWQLYSKFEELTSHIHKLEAKLDRLSYTQDSVQPHDPLAQSNQQEPSLKQAAPENAEEVPASAVQEQEPLASSTPTENLQADDAEPVVNDGVNEGVGDLSAWASYQSLDKASEEVSISAPADLQEELYVDEPREAVHTHAATQLPPQEPAEPRGPNLIEKLISAAWGWLTDGNVFVRVGIVILFMGMTFLTRYAIGQNMVPIETRLAFIAAVAIGLLVWGWRQRDSKRNFSLVVQGGGVGLLYLTIFAGFSLYDVIPSTMAFILLALIVVLAAILSVSQDAKPLALFATVGGFLAPILTSSGNNNYIGLFSYYTLLNLGVFSIAWFKSWRILNLVGFVFTFLVSAAWGVLSYEPQFFSTTEPFLITFFLMYVAIGVLFAHKRTPFYKNYVDSSLIFGTPILAFGLQCAMVKDYEYGVAISAAALGVFYILLATILWKKFGARLRLLSETFLSLGVIFATLAIPFAVDGHLSAAAWAIEGTGILWVSIKQQEKYRRFFASALIFASGLLLLYSMKSTEASAPFISSFFIGCVIIAISTTIASWLLSQQFEGKVSGESSVADMLIVYSVLALVVGFEIEINNFDLRVEHGSLLAVLSGLCIAIYVFLSKRLNWSKAAWVSVFYSLPLCAAGLACFMYQEQLSQYYGYVLWPIVLAVAFYSLKQVEEVVSNDALLPVHILLAVTIIGLLFWDGLWQLMLGYSLLAVLFNYLSNKLSWPNLKYLALGFFPVLVLCGLMAISRDGNLVTLSNLAGDIRPPFQPGVILWPFSFIVYFYLVYKNREIGGANNKYLHYAGAALIGALLLWLGIGPLLLAGSLLAVLFCRLWQRFDWPEMRNISMALLPIMLFVTAVKLVDGSFHVTKFDDLGFMTSSEPGLALWPLSLMALFWIFRQFENDQKPVSGISLSIAILLPVLLLTWEVSWHLLDHFALFDAWHLAWLPITSMAMIALIYKARFWPFKNHQEALKDYAIPCLVVVPFIWSFLQLVSSGDSEPLPWIPLANPLDIVQIIILLGAVFWGAKLLPSSIKYKDEQKIMFAGIGSGFLWANVELLRALHHWVSIPWELPTIVSADISQTALALFWALTGLLTTIFASKRENRILWFMGGALLVAVVLKLFLIDLSAQDTIERIVSFTGVGLLLVAVGYFSPLPPKEAAGPEEDIDDQLSV